MEQKQRNDGGLVDSSCGIISCDSIKARNPFMVALYTVFAIVLLIAAIVIADAAFNSNKIRGGVNITGIDASGKTRSELAKPLDNLESKLRDNKLKIIHDDESWIVDANDYGLKVDKNATIDKAMSYGRIGSLSNRFKSRIGLWFKPVAITPVVSFNKAKLDELFSTIGKKVERLPEDAAIKIVDKNAVSSKSKDGLAIDKNVLSAGITDGIISDKETMTLPMVVVKPDITETNLESTVAEVKQMVKEPIVLKYRADSWDISTDELADWVEFEKVRQRDSWALDAKFDKDQLVAFIEESTKKITVEPKDAEFSIVGDKVTIVPGAVGVKVNLAKAYDDITNVCESDAAREIMLETKTKEPKLTTEDAEKMGIKEKVSSFTTTFNAGQTSRVHNIKTLAGSLDGNLLAPGQVFSFNGTIGPRTAAKGYREAPAIVNGELVPSLGGGVCQVATTLFNAIFFGGFKVVERHNHSFFISHYPTGRDATVSWGGPDLKFKNDTDTYILIKTKTTAGSITIDFYSTKRNIKVDYKTAGPSNFRPSTTQTVNDPSLPKGVKKVVDKGFSGRDVTVYRTVTLDGETHAKDTFVSKYAPKKTIVHVGTGAAPVTTDQDTAADGSATGSKPAPGTDDTGSQSPSVQPQDSINTDQ
jgi:vancomycin resistance protein YoaR